ncbi:MAG: BtpA/SgcQ family protein [Actinobacteria bacterium]|nr:BtpA/SgcQ family protein [Actinomycetota bacterium]
MNSRFRTIFDVDKPLIAMVHLPPLPGTPLYDAARGVPGMVEDVARDLAVLVEAGFDGFLFCNEGDRPYELEAGLEAAATMARVVTECVPAERPFGVDFLWDANCALAVGVATGAAFVREVVTGVWESDMGLWQTDPGKLLRERRRLDADGLAVLMNVTPEFASPIGRRDPAEAARSAVVSSLADAILVSGPMAGAEPGRALLDEIREAVPAEVPVLLNTGARAETIADYLRVADGCIVGSDLKVDGYTWNPVDPERAKRFIDAARDGVTS